MKPWFESAIKTYKHYFEDCEKPVVLSNDDDAVELATKIYTGAKEWFWSNVVIIVLESNPDQVDTISKKYPEIEFIKSVDDEIPGQLIDIAKINSGNLEGFSKKLNKARVLVVQDYWQHDTKGFLRNKNWTLVFESAKNQVWVNSNLL